MTTPACPAPWPVLGAPAQPVTSRLLLRCWQPADRTPFAALNADPEVMRYFAAPLSAQSSGHSMDTYQRDLLSRGWSNWAVALRGTGQFIGFVGLSVPQRALPCTPCVELGWRLASAFWGQGYATEAARAALAVGFGLLALPEIVAFTALLNRPSRAVMQRLGMVDSGEDFDHPALPPDHVLARHCLYRLRRGQWFETAASLER